jgi:hypothetical protein
VEYIVASVSTGTTDDPDIKRAFASTLPDQFAIRRGAG